MSLLFGNLTQDFVTFGMTLSEAKIGNATAAAQLPAAAAEFRHTTYKDAASLVYIGKLIRMYRVLDVLSFNLQALPCFSALSST
jgi:hypothetical protein